MDHNLIKKWTDSVGGVRQAAMLIMEKLECSPSKAEKLAYGRYPSTPTAREQIALSELMGYERHALFRLKKKAA